jgi:radical SAM superfamily enzyme YgiQ (UPF0313 family)
LNELNVLYGQGWRGGLSVVDDNFIGNKKKLKSEILPALIEWSKERKYPFNFITEVSVNLADDEELTNLMVEAGIVSIFVGIETPNDDQNLRRNLLDSIQFLQRRGMIVSAGFIVGFDNDRPNIFEQQINFIQKSGIASAMVGLLNAPTGTKLFKRLKAENRLLEIFSGNNMDGSINFIPKMNYGELIKGYKKILDTIYSQKEYYLRIKQFLNEYKIPSWQTTVPKFNEVIAFIKLVYRLGLLEKGKKYFWKLLILSLVKHPRKFSLAMTFAVYGFHFRKITEAV